MVARVATFEGINVDQAKSTMSQAEEVVRPLVEGLAGYQGYLQLMSSDGKSLSITFFDSEDNARAAEPTFDEEMPRRLGEVFQGEWEGRRVSVDVYEVVADSRG